MPLPFLAALGPLAAKAGGVLAKGAGSIGSFASKHPKLARLGIGALGGGLTQEFGGDEAFNAFLQQMLANQNNSGNGGVENTAGTIIN